MHNLEGWVIKISLGAAFIGVTAIFTGKILFVLVNYFANGNGAHRLASWIGNVLKEAASNVGHSVWDVIFG